MRKRIKFYKIFPKKNNIVIGAIHLPPLLGYARFPGLEITLKNALIDLKSFEQSGVDGIIFENNYDLPHRIFVEAPVISAMTLLGEEIKAATKLPLGVSVLWNDYGAALSIAKLLNLQFIRVPVFVDKVKTDYGIIDGNPKELTRFQKSVQAENVALFTDIHVKHAKILSKYSLVQSAKLAVRNGSDAIIITGKWTGDAPDLTELRRLRRAVGEVPILIGSGADKNNAQSLLKYANGAIVSTSLKSGERKGGERNVKAYQQRIDLKKVKDFVNNLRY